MSKLILMAALLHLCTAYPDYVNQVPNGKIIRHPCDPNRNWPGLGHENPGGAGKTTPFGEHFPGFWNKEICEYDSDGDGLTNGEELGDPDCVWQKGSEPAITDPDLLSHPGVCEPLDAPICKDKNRFLPRDCLARFPTRKDDL